MSPCTKYSHEKIQYKELKIYIGPTLFIDVRSSPPALPRSLIILAMIRDPGDPGGAGGAGDTAGGVGGQENQHQACRTGVNFTTSQAGYLNKDTVRIKVLVI
jgi:hypothetical protein